MTDIAILSNITATSLAMHVGRTTGIDIYQPHGFNTWIREISDPESGLYKSEAKLAFIILHGPSLFGEKMPDTLEETESILSPMAEAIASAAAAHENITFVVSTIDIPNQGIRPLVSSCPETQAAAFWRRSIEARGLPVMELSEIAANLGREQFYNRRLWYMGAIPFSKKGEEALTAEIERIWRAVCGSPKRCLALDLDNTLWGGILGEMGIDGLHLDRIGSGSRFCDFQRRILDLKNNGVLLAVISKNNQADAVAAINEHPAMLLREADFAAIRTNWKQKPQNLESIAEELGIGTDSFVFIDDNPIERDAMRIAHPEVAVPDFPEDTAQLVPFIDGVARDFFLQVRIP